MSFKGLKLAAAFFVAFVGIAGTGRAQHAPLPAEAYFLNHPDKKVSNSAAVMDDEGTIYVGWIREEGIRNNIYVVSTKDGGKTFSEKVKVNTDSDMASGMHQAPSMAVGLKGELYVAWPAVMQGGEFASEIRFTRSDDGGKTFAPTVVVNDDGLPVSHGFESMTVGPDGSVYLAWLDGRDKKQGGSSTYMARSKDGKAFEKNVKVDGNSCPCCRTAITVAKDGAVYVSWRKIFEGELREIVVSRSADGKSFSKSVIVGKDDWKIAGCPHRGPALGTTDNGTLYIAWYTEAEGLPAVYIGQSNDGGETFSKTALPWGKGSFPDHPMMTVNKNGYPLVLWEETTPVMSRVMFYSPGKGNPEQVSVGIRRAHDSAIYMNRKGETVISWTQEEVRFSKVGLRVIPSEDNR